MNDKIKDINFLLNIIKIINNNPEEFNIELKTKILDLENFLFATFENLQEKIHLQEQRFYILNKETWICWVLATLTELQEAKNKYSEDPNDFEKTYKIYEI